MTADQLISPTRFCTSLPRADVPLSNKQTNTQIHESCIICRFVDWQTGDYEAVYPPMFVVMFHVHDCSYVSAAFPVNWHCTNGLANAVHSTLCLVRMHNCLIQAFRLICCCFQVVSHRSFLFGRLFSALIITVTASIIANSINIKVKKDSTWLN